MSQSTLTWARRLGSAARAHWNKSWRNYAVGAGAGLFLAVTGAFGTSAASPLNRLVFWLALLLGGTVCAGLIERFTAERPAVGESRWLKWLVLTGSIGVPMALLSWLLAGVLFGGGGPQGLGYFAWAAAVTSGAMTALMMAINAPGVATSAAPPNQAQTPVRLRDRLDPALRGAEVYAVASEDHYLRVYTSVGSALILMRLSDAIAELDGIEGAQVHRSWWVARNAVEGVRREDRRTLLILKGGAVAPVSRPNVMALRAAGWI